MNRRVMASKVKQVFPCIVKDNANKRKKKQLRKDHDQTLIAFEVLLLLQSNLF